MVSLVEGIISEERRYGSMPYTETGDNHQIFSDIVNSYGLAGCQNQPWCATYQFAMELIICGKERALRNWCMSEQTYVGYNCFSTEAAFQRAGKTGMTPKVGALVIFHRSHMGRVLSVRDGAFTCGEGNTSNKQYDRNGNSCAVKTYAANDPSIRSFCYIDYEDEMNAQQLIKATKAVYEMAHNGHYKYGDSHSLPPCADGVISCDRLIARALWNLGYQNQPKGGITVLNMESYLLKWGAKKITDQNALRSGDIVLFRNASMTPNAGWHAFVLTDFKNVSNISKYDCGSQERINSAQPFRNVPLNQWPGTRWFYCAFRFESSRSYVFSPSTLVSGSENNSAYLATEIFKSRGYKGIYKDGKRQDLELNFRWTIGDMAAAADNQADRFARGFKINVQCGCVNTDYWTDLLGMRPPFTCQELPTYETKGLSVLLVQEILKSRGFKGKDGKDLKLDREWGTNTEYAVKQYQKARGFKQTGVVTAELWKDMINI